jgi:hypothetical protein
MGNRGQFGPCKYLEGWCVAAGEENCFAEEVNEG